MSTRNVSGILVAGLLAGAMATALIAQENQNQRFPGQQPQAQQQGQMGQRFEVNKPVLGNEANSADSQIAGCLIVDNQGEIALGKLAESRANDKDVKDFGERMVKDHTDFMQKLEKFASSNAGSTVGQGLNFVQMKQQIGQKLLELQQRDLDEKQGSQFDKCYIGGQIGAHMQVLATLEVARQHVSPELASLLDQGAETTKMHLDAAQKIAKSLERE